MQIHSRTRKLASLAMLSALAYIVMVFIKIPVIPAPPLKYEPKDVIIVIGGFLYGPFAAFSISAAVSFVEMFTVSTTGIIGFMMNIISTSAFACTASAIYMKKRTLAGAVAGLVTGVVQMSVIMLLWNYIITPVYMGVDRSVVAGMLIPVFLPFNLLKGSLNAAITVIAYKPVKKALQKSGMTSQWLNGLPSSKANAGVILAALFVIASCAALILALQGKF